MELRVRDNEEEGNWYVNATHSDAPLRELHLLEQDLQSLEEEDALVSKHSTLGRWLGWINFGVSVTSVLAGVTCLALSIATVGAAAVPCLVIAGSAVAIKLATKLPTCETWGEAGKAVVLGAVSVATAAVGVNASAVESVKTAAEVAAAVEDVYSASVLPGELHELRQGISDTRRALADRARPAVGIEGERRRRRAQEPERIPSFPKERMEKSRRDCGGGIFGACGGDRNGDGDACTVM